MKTLAERVNQIISELKTDQVGLAKLAGITKGAVNQWIKSKPSAAMSPVPAYALADKTDYQPRWLMLGEGLEKKTKLALVGTEEWKESPEVSIFHDRRKSEDAEMAEVVRLFKTMSDTGRGMALGKMRDIQKEFPKPNSANSSQ